VENQAFVDGVLGITVRILGVRQVGRLSMIDVGHA
jgi:hypothetical protein